MMRTISAIVFILVSAWVLATFRTSDQPKAKAECQAAADKQPASATAVYKECMRSRGYQ